MLSDKLYKALLEDIKDNLINCNLAKFTNNKTGYLLSAQRSTRFIFENLASVYGLKGLAISTIKDSLLFNFDSLVKHDCKINNTILLDIINELKNETLTQKKLEFYTEALYKQGLKLFGGGDINKLKQLLPENMQTFFEDLEDYVE